MGTLTLTEMISELRDNLGGRSTTSMSDARITRALNVAQERIVRRQTFEEMFRLETTTFGYVGTAATDKTQAFSTFSTITDPKEIFSIRVIDGAASEKLEFKHQRVWDQIVPATDELSTGRPSFYTVWNNSFEWYRVPDKSYPLIIRAATWPTALSGSNRSDLNRKDDIIMAYGTSFLMHSLAMREDAQQFFGIAERLMEDAIAMESEKPDLEAVGEAVTVTSIRDYWKDPFMERSP